MKDINETFKEMFKMVCFYAVEKWSLKMIFFNVTIHGEKRLFSNNRRYKRTHVILGHKHKNNEIFFSIQLICYKLLLFNFSYE